MSRFKEGECCGFSAIEVDDECEFCTCFSCRELCGYKDCDKENVILCKKECFRKRL